MTAASEMVTYKIFAEDPDPDMLEYARKHVDEDPDSRIQVVAELRDMIYERGECTPHRVDDDFLLRFLRARNFVVRHAHRLFVNYFRFRENNPDFFKNVYIDRLFAIGDANLMMTQPFVDQSGRRILIYRLGLWEPQKTTVTELFQATLLALELGQMEPGIQILGGVCIFDLGGIKLNHAKHLTPKIAGQIIDIMAWTYPIRIHAIHIVNQSPVFKAGYSVVKPFLNKEIKQKMHFHGVNMASLHKHIDPKYLPARYGGIHPDYHYGQWVECIRSNEKVKKELRDLGYTLEEQLLARDKNVIAS